MAASLDALHPLDPARPRIGRAAHGRCWRATKSRKTGTPAGERILDPPRRPVFAAGNGPGALVGRLPDGEAALWGAQPL